MVGLFGSQLEELIERATSEYLPAAQEDLAANLEICDLIKSKQVSARDAMRILKRRLQHSNPNVQLLTLSLTDACVKNAGGHFLEELASREFVDVLATLCNPNNDNVVATVRGKTQEYFQLWALAMLGNARLGYMHEAYEQCRREGVPFPQISKSSTIPSAILKTQSPPEWTDSDTCVRCRVAFSIFLRKHHCRRCGQTFCQECSSKTIALPEFGLYDQVRVCETCFARRFDENSSLRRDRVKEEDGEAGSRAESELDGMGRTEGVSAPSYASPGADRSEEDLARAIRLSLEDSKTSRSNPSAYDEEEALAAAIAASLSEASLGGGAPGRSDGHGHDHNHNHKHHHRCPHAKKGKQAKQEGRTRKHRKQREQEKRKEPSPSISSSPSPSPSKSPSPSRSSKSPSLSDSPGRSKIKAPSSTYQHYQASMPAKVAPPQSHRSLQARSSLREEASQMAITPVERENVQLFSELMHRITPSDPEIGDPELIQLANDMGMLRDRLRHFLSLQKYTQATDLGRLIAVLDDALSKYDILMARQTAAMPGREQEQVLWKGESLPSTFFSTPSHRMLTATVPTRPRSETGSITYVDADASYPTLSYVQSTLADHQASSLLPSMPQSTGIFAPSGQHQHQHHLYQTIPSHPPNLPTTTSQYPYGMVPPQEPTAALKLIPDLDFDDSGRIEERVGEEGEERRGTEQNGARIERHQQEREDQEVSLIEL